MSRSPSRSRRFVAPAIALPLIALAAWLVLREGAAGRGGQSAASAAASLSPLPSEPPSAAALPSGAPSAAQDGRARYAANAALCQPVIAANKERFLGKPRAEVEGAFLAEGCIPTPSGAWAVRVDAWEKSGEWAGTPTWRGAFTVVHLRADGGPPVEVRLGGRALHGQAIEIGMSFTRLEIPERVDLDRDGAPEIFLVSHRREHEGPYTTSAALLTYRDGAVIEFPGLPRGYRAIRDVDSDGFLDVMYSPYAQVRPAPCTGFGYEVAGPSLLAHGLRDGTFSLDDPVAAGFARRACSTTVESDRVDPELCARLSGASAEQALELLRKACRPPAAGDDGCDAAEGVCYDFAARARLLKETPPLRFDAAPAGSTPAGAASPSSSP